MNNNKQYNSLYLWYKYRKIETLIASILTMIISLFLVISFVISIFNETTFFGIILSSIFAKVSIFLFFEHLKAKIALKTIDKVSNQPNIPNYVYKKTKLDLVLGLIWGLFILLIFILLIIAIIANQLVLTTFLFIIYILFIFYSVVALKFSKASKIKKVLNDENSLEAEGKVIWSEIYLGKPRRKHPIIQTETCKISAPYSVHLIVSINNTIVLKAYPIGNISYALNETVKIKYINNFDYCVIIN